MEVKKKQPGATTAAVPRVPSTSSEVTTAVTARQRIRLGDATNMYEALLKPVHESLTKNWSNSLSAYLNDFIQHLDEEHDPNFTEAAMLVQNSAAYYCRRVDVVYAILYDLVVTMDNVPLENEDGNPEGAVKTSGKRKAKSLEADNLKRLDFTCSQQTLDLKEGHQSINSSLKEVIPNLALKTVPKAGTSVTVLQITSAVLGCKEEFKLFGKTHSDGTINGDLKYDDHSNVGAFEAVEYADSFNGSVQSFQDMDHHQDGLEFDGDQMDEEVAEPDVKEDKQCTLQTVPVRTKPQKLADWEPVADDVRIALRRLKVTCNISMPSQVWDEHKDTCRQLKLPGAKRKRPKPSDEDPDEIQFHWVDRALCIGTSYVIEYKLKLERKIRDGLQSNFRKTIVPNDLIEENSSDDEDHDHFNVEDDVQYEPAESGEGNGCNPFDDVVPEDGLGDEALVAIELFHKRRKEYARQAGEVAERVAKWHNAIAPVLEQAEKRSEFDVYQYGSQILQKFPDLDKESYVPFKSVVGKLSSKNEVSRYFLSTLMLANTYNLEIKKPKEPLVKDSFQLRLITKERGNALTNNVDDGSAASAPMDL